MVKTTFKTASEFERNMMRGGLRTYLSLKTGNRPSEKLIDHILSLPTKKKQTDYIKRLSKR